MGAWWGDALFAIQFDNDRFYKEGTVAQAAALSLTRASVKQARDAESIFSEFAIDTLARTNYGARIEAEAINITRIGFDVWSTGATGTTATQDAEGVDGLPTSAWTVAANANSQRQRNTAIGADTALRCSSFYIKKTVGAPSVYPAMRLGYSGGATISNLVVINTTTGVITGANTAVRTFSRSSCPLASQPIWTCSIPTARGNCCRGSVAATMW